MGTVFASGETASRCGCLDVARNGRIVPPTRFSTAAERCSPSAPLRSTAPHVTVRSGHGPCATVPDLSHRPGGRGQWTAPRTQLRQPPMVFKGSQLSGVFLAAKVSLSVTGLPAMA